MYKESKSWEEAGRKKKASRRVNGGTKSKEKLHEWWLN